MQTLKDRLLTIANNYGLNTREFERRVGLSNGYVRNIKNTLGSDKLEAILQIFPDISRVWLLTGEGPMLLDADAESPVPSTTPPPVDSSLVDKLLAKITEQAETIGALRREIEELRRSLK